MKNVYDFYKDSIFISITSISIWCTGLDGQVIYVFIFIESAFKKCVTKMKFFNLNTGM